MKLNTINFSIAVLISALLSYELYSLVHSELRYFITLGSFILFASTLCLMLGVIFKHPRTGANIRTLCGIFFCVALGTNLAFSLVATSQFTYITTNGIVFTTYLLAFRGIFSIAQ